MLIFKIYNYLKQITVASITNYKILLTFLVVIALLGFIFWIFFASSIFFNDKINKYIIQEINFKNAIKELHLSIAREFSVFCFLITGSLFLISAIIFLALIFSEKIQGKVFVSNIFFDNLGFLIDNIVSNWAGMIIEVILIIVSISFFIHSIFDLNMEKNETTIGMRILLIFSLICFVVFSVDVLCNVFGWSFF